MKDCEIEIGKIIILTENKQKNIRGGNANTSFPSTQIFCSADNDEEPPFQ